MRFLAMLPLLASLSFAAAPADPVFEAYKAFQAENAGLKYPERQQKLFVVSADWVAKWPDNKLAWQMRRSAMVSMRTASAQDWKQVGDNLIRLNPPHTLASSVAYDWMAARVNVPEAKTLIVSEIEWQESRPRPTASSPATLSDLIEEAQFSSRLFAPLLTLANVQMQLKEFDGARATIARVHDWLEGDFKRYYDQDPLEAFPDYIAKFPMLSGQLAEAEGRAPDALAFYQQFLANPYYRREYTGGNTYGGQELWKKLGGTDEGFTMFTKPANLPAGVPSGYPGFPFSPWLAMNYKLPELFAAGPTPDSHAWTLKDFAGKTTLVVLWSVRYGCGGPCPEKLAGLQTLYEKVKERSDIQVVALNKDEDLSKVSAFMKENHFTFPVMVNRPYAEALLSGPMGGQDFIVDGSGSIRLFRMNTHFSGAPLAFVDEALYKLAQFKAPSGH